MRNQTVEEKLFSTFAAVASSLGFNEAHGRIIAALLVSNRPTSLEDLAKRTGYSLAAISLSLDLLEIIGIVRKIKNPNDRKLYAKLDGDVLQGLRNALMFKIQKEIYSTLNEFERHKNSDKRARSTILILEKEVKRLEKYVQKLSEVPVPKN